MDRLVHGICVQDDGGAADGRGQGRAGEVPSEAERPDRVPDVARPEHAQARAAGDEQRREHEECQRDRADLLLEREGPGDEQHLQHHDRACRPDPDDQQDVAGSSGRPDARMQREHARQREGKRDHAGDVVVDSFYVQPARSAIPTMRVGR